MKIQFQEVSGEKKKKKINKYANVWNSFVCVCVLLCRNPGPPRPILLLHLQGRRSKHSNATSPAKGHTAWTSPVRPGSFLDQNNTACYSLLLLARDKLNRGSRGFPGGIVDKNPPPNTGDMGSIPGLRRSFAAHSN